MDRLLNWDHPIGVLSGGPFLCLGSSICHLLDDPVIGLFRRTFQSDWSPRWLGN